MLRRFRQSEYLRSVQALGGASRRPLAGHTGSAGARLLRAIVFAGMYVTSFRIRRGSHSFGCSTLLAVLAMVSCVGSIGDSSPLGSDPGGQGTSNTSAGGPNQTALVVGHTSIRRLTSGELQNSLVDLLNVPAAVVAGLDADIPGPSGFSNDGSALSIGSIQMDQIMGVIDAALTSAFAAPGSPYLKCPGAQDSTCARTQLGTFAARAYRRPLQPTEANDLMTV